MYLKFDIFFRRLFILLALIVFVYALYLMSPVIIPFVSAFFLAYLLNPIVTTLAKYISRFSATVVVYAMIVAIVVLITKWLLPMLWGQARILWDYVPVAVSWYNDTGRIWLNERTNSHLLALDSNVVRDQVTLYLQTNYQVSDVQSIVMKAFSSGLYLLNIAGLAVLVPILTFYFLLHWHERLRIWGESVPRPYQAKTFEIAKDCDTALMSFVKGQFSVMILLGAIYAVQLHFLGLDLGLTIGMIAGIASFVPYLGFGVGIIAAIIAGLLEFGTDWIKLAMIVGAFMIGQVMEGYVLQPLLLGDKIGLSPLWVIFVVLAGASMFGFAGMLIALPVAAVLNVLFHHAYKGYQNSEFYKGQKQYRLF